MTPMPAGVQVPVDLPHPVKGVVLYTWEAPLWLTVLIGALAVGLLLSVLIRWWRRRQKSLFKEAGSAEEILAALERRIALLRPPEPFMGKEQASYFFELSLVFRELIEAACHVPATDLTLKELKLPLRSHLPLAASEIERALQFFERADLIKFADAATSLDEARSWHSAVEGWSHTLVAKALPAPQSAATSLYELKAGGTGH